MESLPQQFLADIAAEYRLSEKQTDVFIQRFSLINKIEQLLAADINISHTAFRTHMTGVYKKFGIEGKGPGKSRKLYDFLVQMYRQSNFC